MHASPTAPTQRATASDWVQRWSHLPETGCSVLDVACGSGRHMAWFCARGHAVWGIDRDTSGQESLRPSASDGPVHWVQADIENGPWPLMEANQPRQFGLVLVTNYLWRPLFPTLLASMAPGGLLIYETFAQGNETVGRPARADFLLQEGELLRICQGMRVIAYEHGFKSGPDRFVQRIVAQRPPALLLATDPVVRHPL